MSTIALLRGINVGGHRKVPMAGLRDALGKAGLGTVATYVQSGNLVLDAPADEATASAIEGVLADEFGLDDVPVVLRTGEQLSQIVARNPFPDEAEADPKLVHVVFLHEAPENGASLDPDRSPDDRFHLDGTELWVHYPNGSGRSRLDLAYIERALGVGGTARNFRTVTKLLEISAE